MTRDELSSSWPAASSNTAMTTKTAKNFDKYMATQGPEEPGMSLEIGWAGVDTDGEVL